MQAVLCHHEFLENKLKILKKLEKENKEETGLPSNKALRIEENEWTKHYKSILMLA